MDGRAVMVGARPCEEHALQPRRAGRACRPIPARPPTAPQGARISALLRSRMWAPPPRGSPRGRRLGFSPACLRSRAKIVICCAWTVTPLECRSRLPFIYGAGRRTPRHSAVLPRRIRVQRGSTNTALLRAPLSERKPTKLFFRETHVCQDHPICRTTDNTSNKLPAVRPIVRRIVCFPQTCCSNVRQWTHGTTRLSHTAR